MKKIKFTTMIYEDLLKQIKIIAIQENRSVSDILNELIKLYIKK